MKEALPAHSDYVLDFFTAPAETAPLSIEGVHDSIVTAAACIHELRDKHTQWDGASFHT